MSKGKNRGIGHKFENKVRRLLKKLFSKKYNKKYEVRRGTHGKDRVLKEVQKEPDFLIVNKKGQPIKRVMP